MIFTIEQINESYWKVYINNPPLNIFDPEFSVELRETMEKLEASETLKVVVFESSNPDFYVAHAELIRVFEFPKGLGETGLSISWPDVAKRIEQASFVSIASIRGRARGLGSEFIQAFDMRFGSKEKAIFGQPEIGIGSFPGGGGMERLHLLTGRARALEILLSGHDFDAETAAAYGWINRAIADDELDAFVNNLATRIATFDKNIIATIKSIINKRAILPSNDQIMETQTGFFESLAQPEARTRIKSLLEKGLQQPGDVELNFAKYL